MFVQVINGIIYPNTSQEPAPGFYAVDGYHSDELIYDNWADATFTGDAVVVRPIERSSEQIKNQIKVKIARHARTLVDQLTATYSPQEVASFPLKGKEAQAFAESNNPLDAPWLMAEAQIRGIPLTLLIASVLQKKALFESAMQEIAGMRGKHSDAIDATQSIKEAIAYDWSIGWLQIDS